MSGSTHLRGISIFKKTSTSSLSLSLRWWALPTSLAFKTKQGVGLKTAMRRCLFLLHEFHLMHAGMQSIKRMQQDVPSTLMSDDHKQNLVFTAYLPGQRSTS
jgi:hypothetical protein